MSDAAPTLVLVPGLLCDEIVWKAAIDRFAPEMPIAVGNCQTQDSITDMAKDILAANRGQMMVAGHSMGGRVALEMIRLAPERIERLALLDTGVHPRKEGEEAKRQTLVDLAFKKGMRALADQWLPPMVHPDRHGDAELMGTLTVMVERMTPELHQRQITALLNRPDAVTGLAGITCPVRLIVGRQDAWSPLEQHEAMLPHLKNAELEIIDDAGHFAPIERPEALVSALDAWMAQD